MIVLENVKERFPKARIEPIVAGTSVSVDGVSVIKDPTNCGACVIGSTWCLNKDNFEVIKELCSCHGITILYLSCDAWCFELMKSLGFRKVFEYKSNREGEKDDNGDFVTSIDGNPMEFWMYEIKNPRIIGYGIYRGPLK